MKKIINSNQGNLPERLDKLLVSITGMTRNKIQNLIKDSKVKISTKIETSPKKIIDEEVEIEIDDNTEVNMNLEPKKMDLDIVYEDEHFAIINKAAGVTVHPGAGNYNDTLVNGLLYYFKNNLSDVNSYERPGIVHRLDRDTTGLMVIAKNNESHANLASQIEQKTAKRKYLALVWGFLKIPEGTINMNLARSARDRTKMTNVQIGGKTAITHYKTLEVFAGGLISLVECTLQTGRTHQIRVHMSKSGHSIIGDAQYGANSRKLNQINDPKLKEIISSIKRQALHAYRLSFEHPNSGKQVEYETDLPEDMQNFVNKLREL